MCPSEISTDIIQKLILGLSELLRRAARGHNMQIGAIPLLPLLGTVVPRVILSEPPHSHIQTNTAFDIWVLRGEAEVLFENHENGVWVKSMITHPRQCEVLDDLRNTCEDATQDILPVTLFSSNPISFHNALALRLDAPKKMQSQLTHEAGSSRKNKTIILSKQT